MSQMTQVTGNQPFKLNGALAGTRGRGVRYRLGGLLESVMEKACYLDRLNRLYADLPETRDDRDFLKTVLELFNIHYQVADRGLERIPREDGLIIVANHPFGAIEGVIMAAMLRDLRDDVKILANGLLQRIPEISDLFIGVDVFGGNGAAQRNISSLKEAMRWVKQGGVLELGRSFVRQEYQRSFAPLMLLWKGIGQYVTRHPRYKILFGPVSISNDYQKHSQQLLVEFLKVNHSVPELGRLVKPRRPLRQQKGLKKLCQDAARQSRDVDDVSELLAQFEPDGKGVPILIKQYLKLGGRLLAFNVDKDFNDAIDGLIMVDLSKTDPRVLRRYMGDFAETFLLAHNVLSAA